MFAKSFEKISTYMNYEFDKFSHFKFLWTIEVETEYTKYTENTLHKNKRNEPLFIIQINDNSYFYNELLNEVESRSYIIIFVFLRYFFFKFLRVGLNTIKSKIPPHIVL